MSFKRAIDANYLKLTAVVLSLTAGIKDQLGEARKKVDATTKVYSQYSALSSEEKKLKPVDGEQPESLPTPPQLLTSTQASVISSYVISKLLSQPTIINTPIAITQQEVGAGVNNFAMRCQNKYNWRLKLNKTVHAITKYGSGGILLLPEPEGLNMETITPGNGHYDEPTDTGIATIQKGYSFLMKLIRDNDPYLSSVGKEVLKDAAVLLDLVGLGNTEPYYTVKSKSKLADTDGLVGGVTSMFAAIEKARTGGVQMDKNSGSFIDSCDWGSSINQKDSKEVRDLKKVQLMQLDYDITFYTISIDGSLVNLDELSDGGVITGNHNSVNKYLVVTLFGAPLIVRPIAQQLIITSSLFLSTDNEDPETLEETLRQAENYNYEYHRALLISLKDIINRRDIAFNPDVYQEIEGRLTIKSFEDLEGKPIDPSKHLVPIGDSAGNLQALLNILPPPDALANDLTGNNALLSANHIKGNRGALESQAITSASESRFFLYAGVFYMNIINPLTKSLVESLPNNPQWIKVLDVEQDKIVTPAVSELVLFKDHFFEEQTGLIPRSGGSPEAARTLVTLISTIPELAAERDLGDVVAYLAGALDFHDFPSLRKPHSPSQRLNVSGQDDISLAIQQLQTAQEIQARLTGNAQEDQGLSPEEANQANITQQSGEVEDQEAAEAQQLAQQQQQQPPQQ